MLLLALLACKAAPEGLVLTLSPQAPTTVHDLELDVQVRDPDGQQVSLDIQWTRDGEALPELDGALRVPAVQTAKGELWEVSVVASDGELSVGPLRAEVEIGNTAPVLSGITITPEHPTALSALEVRFEGQDIDGEELSAEVRWFADNMEVGSGPLLLPGVAQKGQTVRVQAMVSDTHLSAIDATEVLILNSAPWSPTVRLTPERSALPNESDLHCELLAEGLDADNDLQSFEFSWTLNGAEWSGELSTTVYPHDTLPLSALEGGQVWTCAARGDDGEELSAWATSDPVDILTCHVVTEAFLAIDSACNSESNSYTGKDNRIRAFNKGDYDVTGWMNFDLFGLPLDATILSAKVSLFEEWGQAYGGPDLVFVESDHDAWTRSTITRGNPARGAQISETRSYFIIGGWNRFDLDMSLWEWRRDLASGTATLGIDNLNTDWSYVYFHGPDKAGLEPELQLRYRTCL